MAKKRFFLSSGQKNIGMIIKRGLPNSGKNILMKVERGLSSSGQNTLEKIRGLNDAFQVLDKLYLNES